MKIILVRFRNVSSFSAAYGPYPGDTEVTQAVTTLVSLPPYALGGFIEDIKVVNLLSPESVNANL